MKRRIEPEPTFGRAIELHLHVGDQEAVFECPTLCLLPHELPQHRTRSVAGCDVIGRDAVIAIGRFDRQHCMVAGLRDAFDLAAPANVDERQRSRALCQEAFDVVLLQVDEGRPLMAGLRLQIELVHLFILEEHAPEFPRHTLLDHAVAATQPVEYLQRALGKTDGARTGREAVIVVEQHHGDALLREIDRQCEPDRAGADDDDRMPRQRIRATHVVVGILIRMPNVVEDLPLIVDWRHAYPSNVFHISTSRSAVQMRGWS